VEEVEVINVKKMDNELREIDQEVDSIISDFLSTLTISLDIDVEKGVQPPKQIMVEDFEKIDQERDSIIEDFLSTIESSSMELDVETKEEVKVAKEEHKRTDLALAKCGEVPLPKSPSLLTTFKWVKFLFLSFTFSLEYGLIENDGQLRALCGVKSERDLCSGWKHHSKFMTVVCSKWNTDGWYGG